MFILRIKAFKNFFLKIEIKCNIGYIILEPFLHIINIDKVILTIGTYFYF